MSFLLEYKLFHFRLYLNNFIRLFQFWDWVALVAGVGALASWGGGEGAGWILGQIYDFAEVALKND